MTHKSFMAILSPKRQKNTRSGHIFAQNWGIDYRRDLYTMWRHIGWRFVNLSEILAIWGSKCTKIVRKWPLTLKTKVKVMEYQGHFYKSTQWCQLRSNEPSYVHVWHSVFARGWQKKCQVHLRSYSGRRSATYYLHYRTGLMPRKRPASNKSDILRKWRQSDPTVRNCSMDHDRLARCIAC